jgi:MFS transporter, DHA2 family, multidrug resistance protein
VSNAFERNVPVAALASTSVGFAMMCVGMFMAILDVQVVATSLPTIQNALDIPPDQMSWVQTAYLIAEVVAIPLTGFLTRLLSMCLEIVSRDENLSCGWARKVDGH